MSGEDTFIARWSRLKQQAAEDGKRKPRAGTDAEDRRGPDADAGQVSEARGRPEHAHARPPASEPPLDPASLPPIESIVAGTDIRAFLQKGVPAALTKAALRQAWTSDPAIRDFIEVAENQWDFTDPTAIPGFGQLQATDDVGQLVRQALGNLPEAPDAAGALQESPDPIAGAKTAADAAPDTDAAPNEALAMQTQVASLRDEPDDPEAVRGAAPQHPEPAQEVGSAPRHKGHGSALPK